MPAYLIAEVEVQDAAVYERYRPLAAAAIAKHGGRYVVRGGAVVPLEGDWNPSRLVVLEFPDVAKARAFYDSPDYAVALKLRHAAAKSRLLIVDGMPPG